MPPHSPKKSSPKVDPFSGIADVTHTHSVTLTSPIASKSFSGRPGLSVEIPQSTHHANNKSYINSPSSHQKSHSNSLVYMEPYSPRSPRPVRPQQEAKSPKSPRSPPPSHKKQQQQTSSPMSQQRQLKHIDYKTILNLPINERWWCWRVTTRSGTTKTFWNKGPLIRKNPFVQDRHNNNNINSDVDSNSNCEKEVPTMLDKKTGKMRHLFGMKAITFPVERDIMFIPYEECAWLNPPLNNELLSEGNADDYVESVELLSVRDKKGEGREGEDDVTLINDHDRANQGEEEAKNSKNAVNMNPQSTVDKLNNTEAGGGAVAKLPPISTLDRLSARLTAWGCNISFHN